MCSATITSWERVRPPRDMKSRWRKWWSKLRCLTTPGAISGIIRLRWARNIKDRRFAQYFGLIVTFGLAWGILAVVAAPRIWWTWMALGIVAVMRYIAAIVISKRVLQPRPGRCGSLLESH